MAQVKRLTWSFYWRAGNESLEWVPLLENVLLPAFDKWATFANRSRNWEAQGKELVQAEEIFMLWLNICWTTRCQLRDGHKDTSCIREGTWGNSYSYQIWKQSVSERSIEASISLYNRISSFLAFLLFFQCKHAHGCFRSHTSKWWAPGLNLLICAPFHHPTKQFSKRKAANYQIELFIEFQLTSQI